MNVHVECSDRIAEVDGEASTDRLVTFFFVHTLVNVHVECSDRIAEVDGEASTDWLLQASTLSHLFFFSYTLS